MIFHHRWLPVLPLAVAVFIGAAAASINIYLTGLLFAGAAAALFLTVPQALLPSILVTSALNRLGLDAGGGQVRLDLLMVVLAFGVVLNCVAVRTQPGRTLLSPIVIPLLAYALCNTLATIVFATDKARGLKLDTQIIVVVAGVAVLASLIRERHDLERAIKILWIVTAAESFFGLCLVALNLGGVTAAGVQAGDYGLPMAYGTAYEANIFGSLLLGNFFLLLADYIFNKRSFRYAAALIVVLLGMAASETRTVWLGLLVGLVFFIALVMRSHSRDNRLFPVLTVIPILVLVATVLGAATPLAGRILAVTDLHSSSASGRLVIFQAALADWRTHPFLGLGTGSFNFGAGAGQLHPWLPNLFLLTLHDTGVVGLAALGWLIVRFYHSALRNSRLGGTSASIAIGSIAGFTALLIAFQTTSGFWFVYPWIVASLGVLASRSAPAAP